MIIPASLFTVLAVFFVTLSTFNIGVGSNKAYATEASSDTEVNLEIASRINISSPGTTTMTCSSANTLCTSAASVTVGTNNITGYTLQMNATSGYSNALTNGATSDTVPTLSQSYSSANFPVDYWGYTGGTDKSSETGGYNCASNYCPVLAYQSTASNYAPNHIIKITDAPATASATTVTFGAKANNTKPSGTYSTSVTFTAVANAIPAPAMQDFTASACANATTDETFTLRDARDDTEYAVAKLKDGNCWMTQNLALGGSTAMNLTQDDSNVGSGGFTLPASISEGDSMNYTDPALFNYAGNYPSQQATTKYGNFYNWPAATAGSGSSTAGVDAQYDICPKNWRLPSAGSTDYTASEQYNMLNHYISGATWNTGENPYWSGVTTSQFTNAPVSLVFSGIYYNGGLYGQDDNGRWWSSTASDNLAAYFLYANSDGLVRPRSYLSKNFGYSIRCVIPGV